MARVVVGIDESERSRRALREAHREATMRGAALEAVHVYAPPHRDLSEGLAQMPQGLPTIAGRAPRTEGVESEAHHTLQHMVDRTRAVVREELGAAAADVQVVALPGDPVAERLCDHAVGAELLVIGLRRRSPVGKLVLGSDARDILLAAPCPVLAVKALEAEPEG